MKYYLAPLEGITNLYYRKAFDKHFFGVSKYFIPFLNPMLDHTLTNRDKREIDILNNQVSKEVVPQIISKDADATLWLISHLKELGYKEVNLNFGCPSGTVVAKGRGSGMLKDLVKMDEYLDEVFKNTTLPISIKLRLGVEDEKEFNEILNILNKYDIKELIIHPRTTRDKYNGPLHLDVLDSLNTKTKFDIIYNGEIRSKEDLKYIEARYPFIKGIMLGRGLISIPDLVEDTPYDETFKRQRMKDFVVDVSKEYLEKFGWNNTSYFLKEIWVHISSYFVIPNSLKKDLLKAKKQDEFFKYSNQIIDTCPLNNIPNGIDKFYTK